MRTPRSRRAPRLVAALLALPLLLPVATLVPAEAAAPKVPPGAARSADPSRTVTVMTRNLYLGASLDGIIAALGAGDPNQVVAAATATWRTVQASQPEARMAAIADEIVEAKPAAVGLQEVSEWSTFGFNPQTQQVVSGPKVEYDFLRSLLKALAARGVRYREVTGATSTNFTSPPIPVVPAGQQIPTQAVRLVDRDVIIVRDGVKATNAHHGNFETILTLPQPGAPLEVDRGWGSADLRSKLAVFRFVNSHPEAWGPEAIRIGEVTELFTAQQQIAEQTGVLPTVYAGDYNSPAPSAGAYQLLTSRLTDLWLSTHPGGQDPDAGSATCCQAGLLTNTTFELDSRIDLLLGTAGIRALSTYRIGDEPVDLPGNTWWASDHAGVVGSVVVGK